jgi:isopenicillin N synthase-like dioxygenase
MEEGEGGFSAGQQVESLGSMKTVQKVSQETSFNLSVEIRILPDTMPAATLPQLSLARLSARDPAELLALRSACASPGFLYLHDHGVPATQQDRVLRLARDFFLHKPPSSSSAADGDAAPLAPHKAAVARPRGGARGYQRVGENVTGGRRDAHEALDLYRELSPSEPASLAADGGGPLAGPNPWPAHPPALRAELGAYIDAALGVGRALVAAMGAALGLRAPDDEGVFVRETEDSFWVCRLIGYPPRAPGVEDDEVGCGEHTGRWLPAGAS